MENAAEIMEICLKKSKNDSTVVKYSVQLTVEWTHNDLKVRPPHLHLG